MVQTQVSQQAKGFKLKFHSSHKDRRRRNSLISLAAAPAPVFVRLARSLMSNSLPQVTITPIGLAQVHNFRMAVHLLAMAVEAAMQADACSWYKAGFQLHVFMLSGL